MSVMSKPSHNHKIPGRSIPEVRDPFDDAWKRLQRERRARGIEGYLPAEKLTNAIVLHFLALPFEEQARIATEFVARYEAMCGEDSAEVPGLADASPTVVTDNRPMRKGRGKSAG